VFRIRISLNADPDPGFYLKADPDPGFYLNADPDPDPEPDSGFRILDPKDRNH